MLHWLDNQSVYEFLRHNNYNTIHKSEIEDLQNSLKNQLFELVYSAYPEISKLGKSVNIEDFKRLEHSVRGIQSKLRPLLISLEERREAMLRLLKEYNEVENQKAMILVQIEFVNSLERMQSVLEQGNFIENGAIELNQLLYLKSKLGVKDFMEAKYNHCVDFYLTELETQFINNMKDSKMVIEHMRIYSMLDKVQLAYKLVEDITSQMLPSESLFESSFVILETYPTFFDGSLNSIDSKISFLIHSWFSAVVKCLVESHSSLFQPGIPNNFYANYQACAVFMQKVINRCTSYDEYLALIESKPYLELYKKWNVNVYFAVRAKDLIEEFEQVLTMQVLFFNFEDFTPETKQSFHLHGTLKLLNIVRFIWSEKCFILSLTSQFWKLMIRLLKRYVSWVENLANELNLVKCVGLLYDILYVNEEMEPIVRNIPIEQEDLEMMHSNVREVLRPVNEWNLHIPFLNFLLEKADFNQIKVIPGEFRRSEKSYTEPSVFLPSLFLPLNKLREYQSAFDTTKWEKLLCGMIIKRYEQVSVELLTNLQKTEQSLKKLKLKTSNDMNAESKIRLQFLTDAKALKAIVKSFRISTLDVPEYEEMLSLIEKFNEV